MAKHSRGQKAGRIRKYAKSGSTNTRLESIYEDALMLSYHKYCSYSCVTDTTYVVALHGTYTTHIAVHQTALMHSSLAELKLFLNRRSNVGCNKNFSESQMQLFHHKRKFVYQRQELQIHLPIFPKTIKFKPTFKEKKLFEIDCMTPAEG